MKRRDHVKAPKLRKAAADDEKGALINSLCESICPESVPEALSVVEDVEGALFFSPLYEST